MYELVEQGFAAMPNRGLADVFCNVLPFCTSDIQFWLDDCEAQCNLLFKNTRVQHLPI
jgi:hypothetical protein